jgi:hypothetical protein
LREPGLASTLAAGRRLSPASLATTVCPDTAAFERAFTLVLPLSSELTGAELEGREGVIHVYRHERDVQGKRNLPHRAPLVGRVVEVASTAPDGARPAFVARATTDRAAGTISFPVTRFGTFQSYIQVPKATVPLLRETFDRARQTDGFTAPLPEGWTQGNSWQIAAPAGVDASSLPYVLGTNVRGTTYRAGANDAITTRSIVVGGPLPVDWKIVVRYCERVRLGTGDSVTLEVVRPDGTAVQVAAATRAGIFATPGEGFADVGPLDVSALVGTATSFNLRWRLESDGDGREDRGFYVDDLTVSMER